MRWRHGAGEEEEEGDEEEDEEGEDAAAVSAEAAGSETAAAAAAGTARSVGAAGTPLLEGTRRMAVAGLIKGHSLRAADSVTYDETVQSARKTRHSKYSPTSLIYHSFSSAPTWGHTSRRGVPPPRCGVPGTCSTR
jgi:hypothetical protein